MCIILDLGGVRLCGSRGGTRQDNIDGTLKGEIRGLCIEYVTQYLAAPPRRNKVVASKETSPLQTQSQSMPQSHS